MWIIVHFTIGHKSFGVKTKQNETP